MIEKHLVLGTGAQQVLRLPTPNPGIRTTYRSHWAFFDRLPLSGSAEGVWRLTKKAAKATTKRRRQQQGG
jgi:hypothetical protein